MHLPGNFNELPTAWKAGDLDPNYSNLPTEEKPGKNFLPKQPSRKEFLASWESRYLLKTPTACMPSLKTKKEGFILPKMLDKLGSWSMKTVTYVNVPGIIPESMPTPKMRRPSMSSTWATINPRMAVKLLKETMHLMAITTTCGLIQPTTNAWSLPMMAVHKFLKMVVPTGLPWWISRPLSFIE